MPLYTVELYPYHCSCTQLYNPVVLIDVFLAHLE